MSGQETLTAHRPGHGESTGHNRVYLRGGSSGELRDSSHLAVQPGSLESTARESQPCSQSCGEIISPSKEHCNLRSKGSPSCKALYRLMASPWNTHSRPLQQWVQTRTLSKVPSSLELDWPSKPLSPKNRTSLHSPAHWSARHRPAAFLLAHWA